MQRKQRHPLRTRILLRTLIIGIALPCVYLGGASAAFYYHQRIRNINVNLKSLGKLPAPTSATRLMVIAPHCDDETLGAAGLIQQTLHAGGSVRTVIITNGDGYPAAVEQQLRVVKAGPKDFIKFASMRQTESLGAMAGLGVAGPDTIFLGFPDQGTASLWQTNWNEATPFASAFTGCRKSPYSSTFNAGSCYCGADLVRDLRTAMAQFQPTLIVVTHPSEDHPDHAYASCFSEVALAELKSDPQERSWATKSQLMHYLIHRGDWPVPQGANTSLPLTPPAAMLSIDTAWSSLPLSRDEVKSKAKQIAAYPSQTAIMPAFLQSFARTNEIFGTLRDSPLPVVPDGSISPGNGNGWKDLAPLIRDPARDNLLRDLQGSGDLLAVYAARDSQYLYVRLMLRAQATSSIKYNLLIRPFSNEWKSPDRDVIVSLSPGKRHDADGIVYASSGNSIDAKVPLDRALSGISLGNLTGIGVSAETWLSGVQVDRTETRFIPANR